MSAHPERDEAGNSKSEPSQPRRPVFRVHGLTKIYRTGEVEVPALRGVDLELFEGEMIVLIGPSGSGKSTLLNILGGLDRPSAGRVFFRDAELTAYDERALTLFRREHVGFVFQFALLAQAAPLTLD